MKTCSKCHITKNITEFLKEPTRSRHCKDCTNLYKREWSGKNRQRTRASALASHRKQEYNLTPDEYALFIASTDNRCEICGTVMVTPCVDHNHITKKVRGVLCSLCNIGLGQFKDNINLLQRASHYLVRTNT